MKFDHLVFLQNYLEKIQILLQSNYNNMNTDVLYCTFIIISRLILLRMRNVSAKLVRKIKILILCPLAFTPQLLLLLSLLLLLPVLFSGERRGTHTPKHLVNLTGENKNFKTYYGYLCDLCQLTAFIFSDLSYKMVIFLSQTESTTKHFLRKKH
jgi:hypothetical protein